MSEKKSKANFTFLLLDSSTFSAEPFKRERNVEVLLLLAQAIKMRIKLKGFHSNSISLELSRIGFKRAQVNWKFTRRQRTKLHCMEVVGHRPFLRAKQKGLKTRVLCVCVCVCVYVC